MTFPCCRHIFRTFFFCFLQASQPRPEGTPGIVRRYDVPKTSLACEHHGKGSLVVMDGVVRLKLELEPRPHCSL
jgi:hypothetical protein